LYAFPFPSWIVWTPAELGIMEIRQNIGGWRNGLTA
jgi:hypothetical protein